MKDILFGFLSKTLNMDADRLAEHLYKKADDGTLTEEIAEGALTELLRLDAERVGKLKPDTKTIFDNGYKKAEKEIAERWEAQIREKFGLRDAQVQGEALIEAAKAALTSQEGIKPDKIKTSQEYLDLEKRMQQALADKERELQDRIAEVEGKYTREQTWSKVSSSIRASLQGLNPVLPSDPAKADRIMELFMDQFRGYDFQADDQSGGFIPLKDGQRVEDAHGYARALSDLVRERAEMMFEFKEQEPAGNAGNKNGLPHKRSNQAFKSEQEYLAAYAATSDPAEKEAMYQAYKAQTWSN